MATTYRMIAVLPERWARGYSRSGSSAAALAFVVLATACDWTSPKPNGTLADEEKVYEVVLAEMMRNPTHSLGPADRPSSVVVINRVPPVFVSDEEEFRDIEPLDDAFEDAVPGSLRRDFKRKNTQSRQLETRFDLPFDYVLVSPQEIDELFSTGPDGWRLFYRRFPGSLGFVTFSRVGFDPALTTAVVYAAQRRGGLAGEGTFYLLTREGGTWKVASSLGTWVS